MIAADANQEPEKCSVATGAPSGRNIIDQSEHTNPFQVLAVTREVESMKVLATLLSARTV